MTVQQAYTLGCIEPSKGLQSDMDDVIIIRHPNGTIIDTVLTGNLPTKKYYYTPILMIYYDNGFETIVLDI